MTGIELILSTVFCLSCGNKTYNVLDTKTPNYVVRLPTQLTKLESLQNLQKSINGKTLKIVTLEDYPLSYTELLPNGTRIGKGIAFTLINSLQKKLNFSYEVVLPESNIIGSTADYKKSLIEMLNSSKADLAAAFLPMYEDGKNVIDYSTTLDEGEWIIIQKRLKDSASGSGLLKPFDAGVWVLILVSVIIVSPVIYRLIKLRCKIVPDGLQEQYSLGHITWFVYGALVKQGSVLSPVADSNRLLFATWWLFITILTSFYTANLTAFLTLAKFTVPFNRAEDVLMKQKNFVAIRGGGIEYSIKNDNESLWMFNKMLRKNRAQFTTVVEDNITLYSYVYKKGYLFIRDRPAVNHLIYNDFRRRKKVFETDLRKFCPFATSNHPFLKMKRSFAYPKGSNLPPILDPELMKLVEGGVIKHLKSKNLPKPEICPQDLGSLERKLSNGDLMLTYFVMMGGYATSFLAFLLEMCFRCYRRKREQNSKSKDQDTDDQFQKDETYFGAENWTQRKNTKQYAYNITPPPPYTSIFNGSSNKNSNRPWRSKSKKRHQFDESSVHRTINGRDYVVFQDSDGHNRLAPVRGPSASLFQYTFKD